MGLNLKAPEMTELRPRITVLGVGGAGGNAVNNMIAAKLEGVEFVVANTDAQALSQSRAQRRIQMGARITEGLGAGARPDVGRAAAEESLDEIMQQLSGSHMVFITAGMGGGTGTGAAPVIARAVREQGILTVGVVTKPFAFEGEKRMRFAERGLEELQAYVDTLLIIPNQNLFRVANDRTTFAQAFAMADEVLHSGVRGITDLIVMPGLINLDFADIKTVMSEMGKAMMGTGEAEGEDRALRAAESAISNPLLDDVSMKGARGVLINITGGTDMMLFEVDQAANRIRAEVDPDANIIFGGTILENMEGRLRVSVVATGIEAEQIALPPEKPEPRRPQLRPVPLHAGLKPVAANPVHRQVETIASQMEAAPVVTAQAPAPAARPISPVEQEILATEEGRVVEESDDIPPMPPYLQPQPVQRPLQARTPAPPPQEETRSVFGFLGRKKKAEPRVEPASKPRATAQVMNRSAAQDRQPQSGEVAEDLFPDHNRSTDVEIPAFLRRQAN